MCENAIKLFKKFSYKTFAKQIYDDFINMNDKTNTGENFSEFGDGNSRNCKMKLISKLIQVSPNFATVFTRIFLVSEVP